MGVFGKIVDMVFGPPRKEKYDKWISELRLRKKDWEDIINQRKGEIPTKVWNRIQGWSSVKIQEYKVEMKHGGDSEQIPGLLLEHLYIANEILRYKERAVETQREIDNTIKERDVYYSAELKAA